MYVIALLLLAICLFIGLTFNCLGTISLYRFPDVYTRLHGTTKCTTFGSIFTSTAVVIYSLYRYGNTGDGRFLVLFIHTVIAVLALLITNATGAHAIARAAHRSGVKPALAVVDRLAERERKGGVANG
ncbi:MAG TPA: monovalent cation/H(+) antiporter subunit G [Thermosynergistes sp.]|jgi:multicomponent Na+:H+ antiporter subunit G|nr:monovalent cation/H(+) antiporter subunit G [Synergistota bacterium]HOK19288.1 monovalent cation/H(+) antiporter subunit G [Thermosynergistes sp.]HOM24765.1 monovalent cation/H(+) antiporter subunit G [Thermosynergistes sp.]